MQEKYRREYVLSYRFVALYHPCMSMKLATLSHCSVINCFFRYEIHYQKGIASNYSPSALMERFLDDAKNGSSLNNLGLVIDATGCDTFLHDAK